jgi:hypothetical protein
LGVPDLDNKIWTDV